MPRPQKNGLDYFPLDVTFFSDPKIKILKARYGVDGVSIYLYLLCEIYRAGYYLRFSDDSIYIRSSDLAMSAEKVTQVLNFLLERSLFDNTLFQSDKVLTCLLYTSIVSLCTGRSDLDDPIRGSRASAISQFIFVADHGDVRFYPVCV